MNILSNYLEYKGLYYTVLASELLNRDYSLVSEKVLPIFLCEDNVRIRQIISDPVFKKLKSTVALRMRINYISSFCKNKKIFGNAEDEMSALIIKKEVYGLIEELSKNVVCNDSLIMLAQIQKEKEKLTAALALILYLQGKYDNKCASLLGKATKNGDVDAAIIYLFLADKDHRDVIYNALSSNIEFNFYPDLAECLKLEYLTENNKPDNLIIKGRKN